MEFELSKEFHDRFRHALEAEDNKFILESLDGVNPADITTLLLEFDAEESKQVFDLLPQAVNADILNELDEDIRMDFMTNFTSVEIASFVDES